MKLTRQQKQIIDAGTTIALDRPTDQDKAFLARQLVQTTLPHADPGNVPVWSRSNGNLTQNKDAEPIPGESGLAGQLKKQLAERTAAAERPPYTEAPVRRCSLPVDLCSRAAGPSQQMHVSLF